MSTSPETATRADRAAATAPASRWIALAVVLSASFMQLVDVSIVNVAIPSIQDNLGASYGQIQLVISFYQLAFASLLITGGRLGDIAGRRRLFMLGMAGFTLASALCGLAQSPEMLVASRLLQGGTAAMMYPQVFAVISTSFGPSERHTAFGITGAVIALATIMGPLLGGLLIEGDLFGLGWRPIFLVNVPVGILALLAAARWLPESRGSARLDLGGVAVVATGLLLLVYPITEGRSLGWPWWTWVSIAAAVVILGAFAVLEFRVERRGGAPLVPLSLFREHAFSPGLILGIVFFMAMSSFFLTQTMYLQIGHGFSALAAGLTGLPFAIGSGSGSMLSTRLVPRMGRNVMHLGVGLLLVGMSGMYATVNLTGTALDGYELIPALLVSGLGLGLTMSPLISTVLSGVRAEVSGSASGVLSTAQQVGGAIGVALIGVVFFGALSAGAPTSSASVEPQLRTALAARHVPAGATDEIVSGFRACFQDMANTDDATVLPASCRQQQAGGGQQASAAPDRAAMVRQVVAPAAEEARKLNFTAAYERALLCVIGLFATAFVLVFWLPKRRAPRRDAPPAAH